MASESVLLTYTKTSADSMTISRRPLPHSLLASSKTDCTVSMEPTAPYKFVSETSSCFLKMNSHSSTGHSLTAPKTLGQGRLTELAKAGAKPLRSQQNVFFNEKIPLAEFKRIADLEECIDVVADTWSSTKERYDRWISKSCASVSCSAYQFHTKLASTRYESVNELQLTPPPPGFRSLSWAVRPRSLWDEKSRVETLLQVKLDNEQVDQAVASVPNELVLSPIKKGLCKREVRGKFTEEIVTAERTTGTLKFYQLKKRFGFITLDEDESDVFLCEDDIVLSGIHHKHFKDTVLRKNPLRFSFRIKTYEEQGKAKRKAIEIELVTIV